MSKKRWVNARMENTGARALLQRTGSVCEKWE